MDNIEEPKLDTKMIETRFLLQIRPFMKKLNAATTSGEYFFYYEKYLISKWIQENLAKTEDVSKNEEPADSSALSSIYLINIRENSPVLLSRDTFVEHYYSGKKVLGHEQDSVLLPLWRYLSKKENKDLSEFFKLDFSKCGEICFKFLFVDGYENALASIIDSLFYKNNSIACDLYSSESVISNWSDRVKNSLVMLFPSMDDGERERHLEELLLQYEVQPRRDIFKRFCSRVFINLMILSVIYREDKEREVDEVLAEAVDWELSILTRSIVIKGLGEVTPQGNACLYFLEKYRSTKEKCISLLQQWLVFLTDEAHQRIVNGESQFSESTPFAFEEFIYKNIIRFISTPKRPSGKQLGQLNILDIGDFPESEDEPLLWTADTPLPPDAVDLQRLCINWSRNVDTINRELETFLVKSGVPVDQKHLLNIEILGESWKTICLEAEYPSDKEIEWLKRLQEWLVFIVQKKDYQTRLGNDPSLSFDRYINQRSLEFLERIKANPKGGSRCFSWHLVPKCFRKTSATNDSDQMTFTEDEVRSYNFEIAYEEVAIPAFFVKKMQESLIVENVSQELVSKQFIRKIWDEFFNGKDEIAFLQAVLSPEIIDDQFGKKEVGYISKNINVPSLRKEIINVLDKQINTRYWGGCLKFLEFEKEFVEKRKVAFLSNKKSLGCITKLNSLRYSIIKKLGSGAFGAAYLVEDSTLKRKVVFKFLIPSRETKEHVDQIIEEASILAGLRHENIITVFDLVTLAPEEYELESCESSDQEKPSLYAIVMQYIENSLSLEEYVIRNKHELEVDDRVDLFTKVCRGIQFVHDVKHSDGEPLCHGDIKPDNIIVDSNGCPVIIDFGLASYQDRAPKAVGAKTFASPRREHGLAVSVDDDIFSLGMLLCWLFLGNQFTEKVRSQHDKLNLFFALQAVSSGIINTTAFWQKNSLPAFAEKFTDDSLHKTWTTGNIKQRDELYGINTDYLAFLSQKPVFRDLLLSSIVSGFGKEAIYKKKEEFYSLLNKLDPEFRPSSEEPLPEYNQLNAEVMAFLGEGLKNVGLKDLTPRKVASLFKQPLTQGVVDTFFKEVSIETLRHWHNERIVFTFRLILPVSGGCYLLLTTKDNMNFYKIFVGISEQIENIFKHTEVFELSDIDIKNFLIYSLVEDSLELSGCWIPTRKRKPLITHSTIITDADQVVGELIDSFDVAINSELEDSLSKLFKNVVVAWEETFDKARGDWLQLAEHLSNAESIAISCEYGGYGDATPEQVLSLEEYVEAELIDPADVYLDEDSTSSLPEELPPILTFEQYIILNHPRKLKQALELINITMMNMDGHYESRMKMSVQSKDWFVNFSLIQQLDGVEVVDAL